VNTKLENSTADGAYFYPPHSSRATINPNYLRICDHSNVMVIVSISEKELFYLWNVIRNLKSKCT
jgi:hypothetical protein